MGTWDHGFIGRPRAWQRGMYWYRVVFAYSIKALLRDALICSALAGLMQLMMMGDSLTVKRLIAASLCTGARDETLGRSITITATK